MRASAIDRNQLILPYSAGALSLVGIFGLAAALYRNWGKASSWRTRTVVALPTLPLIGAGALMLLHRRRRSAETEQLYLASYRGEIDEVRELLDRGAEVNAHRTADGRTPLYAAASGGQIDVARLLLERGAGLEERDDRGGTPLLAACWARHVECAAQLLQRGAEVRTVDSSGYTPYMLADCRLNSEGKERLFRLMRERDPDIVNYSNWILLQKFVGQLFELNYPIETRFASQDRLERATCDSGYAPMWSSILYSLLDEFATEKGASFLQPYIDSYAPSGVHPGSELLKRLRAGALVRLTITVPNHLRSGGTHIIGLLFVNGYFFICDRECFSESVLAYKIDTEKLQYDDLHALVREYAWPIDMRKGLERALPITPLPRVTAPFDRQGSANCSLSIHIVSLWAYLYQAGQADRFEEIHNFIRTRALDRLRAAAPDLPGGLHHRLITRASNEIL